MYRTYKLIYTLSGDPSSVDKGRVMGQLKRLTSQGYTVEGIRKTLLAMADEGIVIGSPMQVLWKKGGMTWYEFINER